MARLANIRRRFVCPLVRPFVCSFIHSFRENKHACYSFTVAQWQSRFQKRNTRCAVRRGIKSTRRFRRNRVKDAPFSLPTFVITESFLCSRKKVNSSSSSRSELELKLISVKVYSAFPAAQLAADASTVQLGVYV